MEPVRFEQIKNIADYELERERWRPEVMAIKDRRRIRVGDHLTFLFENQDTVRYQVQEMMRIERIVKPDDIERELEVYNELLPGPDQLSASLLIEYETPELRSVWLRELLDLENHIWLEIPGTPRAKAVFDGRQIASDRLSSVQYIKFQLSPEQVNRFPHGARIVVTHPKYQITCELTSAQLKELNNDFNQRNSDAATVVSR
jgi:Protein of unknown function (DUF3501)